MAANASFIPGRPDSLVAVVLDWAGTIADFGSRAPAMVFIEVFRREGVEITIDEAREPMGRDKREHIEWITRMPRVAETWLQKHGRACSSHDVDRMYGAFLPLQIEALRTHSTLIPGAAEAASRWRGRGLAIGSSTGYTRQLMEIVLPEARRQGFEPDAVVCADDVPGGRPHPWMMFENARRLGRYPMSAFVKVDDTLAGIEAGLNAGAWSVGVTRSGNELGLSEADVEALPADDLDERLAAADDRMRRAGAHYTVQTIASLDEVLDDIESRLRRGERP
jgi:phosphonoacetaldehyde hydrolase